MTTSLTVRMPVVPRNLHQLRAAAEQGGEGGGLRRGCSAKPAVVVSARVRCGSGVMLVRHSRRRPQEFLMLPRGQTLWRANYDDGTGATAAALPRPLPL